MGKTTFTILGVHRVATDVPSFGGTHRGAIFFAPTWWLIPRIVSGLVHPNYKWIPPTYPIYNWGYNPLTSRGMSHQVSDALRTMDLTQKLHKLDTLNLPTSGLSIFSQARPRCHGISQPLRIQYLTETAAGLYVSVGKHRQIHTEDVHFGPKRWISP